MLFELSKDKSLLSMLSKANLDEHTAKLVKGQANPTEIKKSLIENINSDNIVAYRKYIKKAEEEEETIREREERKITESQRKKVIQLLAEKEGTSKEEVNTSVIPTTKKEARRLIRELERELRTEKDIGVDDDSPQTSELETDKDKQTKVQAAEASKERRLEAKKKDAQRQLNKATNWLGEVEDLVEKLDYTVLDGKVEVKRLAEYQKFGNSLTESNEVISLIMLYEGNDKYLSDRYSEVLVDYDFGKGKESNILMPYKQLKGSEQMMPVPKKAVFVNDLDERWSKLTKANYKGVKLSDIVKEMHRKRHGKQPVVDRKDKQRKEELQRLQRYISGESPRDASKFKKLRSKVKKINSQVTKSNADKLSIEENIKRLKGLDTEQIVAEKVRRISRGIKDLSDVGRMREAIASIKDIQENPEKYAEEFTQEIKDAIEEQQEKLVVVTNEIDKLNMLSPVLRRVRRALGQIDNVREDTGKEPAGEVKRILGRLTVHIIRLDRTAGRLTKISEKVEDKTDSIIERLQRGETVGETVEGASINSLRGLNEQFAEHKENIDSIMNEYDNLVGGTE